MTNGIAAELKYNPWSDNSYKGMLKGAIKWGFGRKKKVDDAVPQKRADDVHVQIYKVNK